MFFDKKNGKLIGKRRNETVQIEAWGENALRVRSTMYPEILDRDWALMKTEKNQAEIKIEEDYAEITNGKLRVHINHAGVMTFYKDGKMIFREYHRNYDSLHTGESRC